MPRAELTAQVYSTTQAQAVLGVCAASMYNWRRKGVLVPLVATGNCNVYSRADVEAFRAARGRRFKRGALLKGKVPAK